MRRIQDLPMLQPKTVVAKKCGQFHSLNDPQEGTYAVRRDFTDRRISVQIGFKLGNSLKFWGWGMKFSFHNSVDCEFRFGPEVRVGAAGQLLVQVSQQRP